MAGKRDTGVVLLRVVVTEETTHQTLEATGRGLNLLRKDNSANFLMNKSKMKHSEVSTFGQYAKKLQIKSRTRSRSRPVESKGFY